MTAPPAIRPSRKGACIREIIFMYLSSNPWVRATMVEKIMVVAPTTAVPIDRKSTRLNSSHLGISYAVFCLKKKNNNKQIRPTTLMQFRHQRGTAAYDYT